MNLLKSLKYLNKNSSENKCAKCIIDTLPSNDIVANEILAQIGNKNTNVILDEDIKNSYYIYLKDTIYISNKEKNNGIHRICLVAHECVHSIQSKLVQKMNFILSNIELIAFILCLIFAVILKSNIVLYMYIGIFFISLLPRLYLELNAIFNSLNIAKTYLEKKLKKEEVELIVNIYKTQTKLLLPFALISLFFGKILRVIIIILITFIL